MNEPFPYNHPLHKDIRRSLRKNSTQAEKILWEKLKAKKLHGLKFRSQYGVGRYIVDFYCPQLRLAIELDGSHHLEEETQEYDQQRQDYIESFDIHFLRFTNDQIYSHLDEVLKEIEEVIKKLSLLCRRVREVF